MVGTTVHILLTGATGFIGGTILDALYRAHPEFHVTALVRRPADAEILHSNYPNVELVIGTLSDLALLTSTAATADIVIHAAGDIGNIPAIHAMIDGLVSNGTTRQSAPYLLSITGSRRLLDTSIPVTGSKDLSARPWSDITDAEAILSLPDTRWHAKEDRSILDYGRDNGVETMLVSPGQCLGRGTGLFRKENVIAAYYRAVLSHRKAFVVGDGSASWSWLSTRDLGNAVVILVEQAGLRSRGPEDHGQKNLQGYYFAQTGDVSMLERAEAVSKRLGLGDVDHLSGDAVKEFHPFGPFMWGSGATFRADRLRKAGWKPKDLDWKLLMEEDGGERA